MCVCQTRLNQVCSEREAPSAICVQRFDDSLNPAIHITYRVSRRSSSLREPRDPSLKGIDLIFSNFKSFDQSKVGLGLKKEAAQKVFLITFAQQQKKSVSSSASEVKYTVVKFLKVLDVNDPSAGSPTETLLRLLLPRNVQI